MKILNSICLNEKMGNDVVKQFPTMTLLTNDP